jgi:Lrp/AsnC family transcriptional regulator for asnA, asnC and gidA
VSLIERHRPPDSRRYDELDAQLIGLLQEDGRMSNSEIARRLGVAEGTVRKRLARITAQGIARVTAVPSPEAAGRTQSAIIGVSCDVRRIDEIADVLADHVEVRYLGYSTGDFDLVMECFFFSNEHLLDFIRQTVGPIEGVKGTRTFHILKVRKFSFEWELPPAAR